MGVPKLVVRVHNARGGPLDKARVQVTQDNRPLLPVESFPGTHETPLLENFGDIVVSTSQGQHFPVSQKLKLAKPATASQLGTATFDGGQEEASHSVDVHNADTGPILEYHVVLSHLADATTDAKQKAAALGLPFGLGPTSIVRHSTPILNPAPPPFTNATNTTVDPGGQIIFAQGTTTPQLYAIYLPPKLVGKLTSTKSEEEVTLPLHVFFHPTIPQGFKKDSYPFGLSYMNLASRYLLTEKRLVHQSRAADKETVVLFPVGEIAKEMGTLPSAANMRLMLHEIRYLILRKLGVRRPLLTGVPAALAMSGFSAGIRRLATILNKPDDSIFHDEILKEVYVFDGMFDGRRGRTELQEFCNAIKRWFRKGADNRVVRVYAQNADWISNLEPDVTPATVTTAPNGAREIEAPQGSLVLMPTDWFRANMRLRVPNLEAELQRGADAANAELRKKGKPQKPVDVLKREIVASKAHQSIPETFAEHAATNQKI